MFIYEEFVLRSRAGCGRMSIRLFLTPQFQIFNYQRVSQYFHFESICVTLSACHSVSAGAGRLAQALRPRASAHLGIGRYFKNGIMRNNAYRLLVQRVWCHCSALPPPLLLVGGLFC